jgi:nucleotide-binding universal stress UspA family protein
MRPGGFRPMLGVAKERTEAMFKTIVWATDGSELADAALDHVRELAGEDDSKIVAVHANEVLRGRPGGYPAFADEPEVEEKIEKQVGELRDAGTEATFVIRTGNKSIATLIADAAAEADADLIVVATHGAGGVTATLMGSVARALCHTARSPLLVIPPVKKGERQAAKDDRLAAV